MKLKLVPNRKKYHEFIRTLRNNPRVKPGFIQQIYIKDSQHVEYMKKFGKHYRICLDGEIPIGYIGCVNSDLRLAVLPEYQRKGVGSFMLKKYMELNNDFVVKIKIGNKASRKLFEKAGFEAKYLIYEKK